MWSLVKKRLQTAVATRSVQELMEESSEIVDDRLYSKEDLLNRFNRLASTTFGSPSRTPCRYRIL